MVSERNYSTNLPFLQGGGEMGALIRNYQWEANTLKSPEQWPQSLRTTLGILLHSAFPMFLFWGDDLICFYNDAFRPSLGNEGKHPALGKKGMEVWPEIWDFIGPLITQVKTTGEAVWFEDQLVPFYRNGTIENIYWTFSYSPAYGDNGEICGVFVTCTETTKTVETLSDLTDSKDQLAFAVDATELGVWDLNPLTNKFTANKRLKEWFGLQPDDEIELPNAVNAMAERDRERVATAIQKALQPASGGHYDIEYTIVNPFTKVEKIVRAKGRAWFGEDGTAYRFNGTLQDITEQSIARKKIEESEALFRSLIQEASVASCLLTGPNMIVEVANKIMLGYWGKSEDILGMPLSQAIPELEGQPFLEILQRVYTTGEPFEARDSKAELVVDGVLGTYYFDFTYKALRNANGEIFGVMDTAVDVTEKVLAAKKIEEAEERARLSIDAAELGTFELNLVTDELITSDRFDILFNGGYAGLHGDYINTIHPDDRSVREEAYNRALKTGLLEYEARVIWHDGSMHWVRAQGIVSFDADRRPVRMVGVIQDITEEKAFFEELEKQVKERTAELENANKELQRSNAHLEEFAHAASHDLKEPIRKIHFFTERLRTQLSDKLSSEDERMFARVEHASQRMNSLIDDLLLYSHVSQRPHEKEEVDLNEKLKNVLEDLELDIQEKKAVLTIGKLPVVQGYRRQLQQLFQNLVSNALKYSRSGVTPEISITSSVVSGSEAGLSGSTSYDCIIVKDNGIGFDQEDAEKIFHMFQRLHGRNEYEGTGIGLSIARKVIENHDGRIVAISTPGKGASFNVYLPIEN